MDPHEQVNRFLWTNFPVPTDKLTTKIPWLQNPQLRRYNTTHTIVKDTLNLFDRQINILSLSQLYQELLKAKPIFGAPQYDEVLPENERYYETREKSYQKLEEFLGWQLNEETEEFIIFLYHLLNKTSGKINCMNIIGEPSSGKTFFARLIKDAHSTVQNH